MCNVMCAVLQSPTSSTKGKQRKRKAKDAAKVAVVTPTNRTDGESAATG